MKHKPRKRFGQNFLKDHVIISRILSVINPQPLDNMLEIGPGLGALTQPLLKNLNHIKAIEIDNDLQEHLQKNLPKNKLTLIHDDALKVDYQQFGPNLRIVGNLPYNISTPLLIKLINYADIIKDMHFMLQYEVVARIAANPKSKAYGRLSVMMQYYFEPTFMFQVPATAFNPQPKVESAIIRLTPKTHDFDLSFTSLEKVVAQAFTTRRKTLANNLKPLISAEELLKLNINPKQRPEEISVETYAKITRHLQETCLSSTK